MSNTDPFFQQFGMQPVHSASFDAALREAGDDLVGVYFWGEDCYNCDQFKKSVAPKAEAFRALGLRWLHADVYADKAIGLRFGLHGVPTFYFFHRSHKLGRITSWPGWPPFETAVHDLRRRIAAPAS